MKTFKEVQNITQFSSFCNTSFFILLDIPFLFFYSQLLLEKISHKRPWIMILVTRDSIWAKHYLSFQKSNFSINYDSCYHFCWTESITKGFTIINHGILSVRLNHDWAYISCRRAMIMIVTIKPYVFVIQKAINWSALNWLVSLL